MRDNEILYKLLKAEEEIRNLKFEKILIVKENLKERIEQIKKLEDKITILVS